MLIFPSLVKMKEDTNVKVVNDGHHLFSLIADLVQPAFTQYLQDNCRNVDAHDNKWKVLRRTENSLLSLYLSLKFLNFRKVRLLAFHRVRIYKYHRLTIKLKGT